MEARLQALKLENVRLAKLIEAVSGDIVDCRARVDQFFGGVSGLKEGH
jgi:hypothetical protein